TDITASYQPTDDVTRPHSVTSGAGTETYYYNDAEKRLTNIVTVINGRPAFVQDYEYDSLDRIKKVTYPNEYGLAGIPRKDVQPSYDAASRVSGLQVGGVSYASDFTYNAASQTTSMKVGPANAYQTTESYEYDPKTGLLANPKVYRGTDQNVTANQLLNLSYSYLRDGTTDGRTGQLTGITNNHDTTHAKDRSYQHDDL